VKFIPGALGEAATMAQLDALLLRITTHPRLFGGKPFIRGSHVTVECVLGLLALGQSPESIVRHQRGLEIDDVRACLVYARRLVGYAGAIVSLC